MGSCESGITQGTDNHPAHSWTDFGFTGDPLRGVPSHDRDAHRLGVRESPLSAKRGRGYQDHP